MIISASRRTDIPAFFAEWFINRIDEGYVLWQNPFNPRQTKRISLKPEDVDVIVFWTKNPPPLFKYLPRLDDRGYRYYFQFTLNDYPRFFEPAVPSLEQRIAVFRELSGLIGAEKVVWRYDPIIISDVTPVDYHRERFARLAAELQGCTRRVIISFVDIYGKVAAKFKKLEKEKNIKIIDFTAEHYRPELVALCRALKDAADYYGMEIQTCCEKLDNEESGLKRGKCIDNELIYRVFGYYIPVAKDKNQRGDCLCVQSVDIGFYNTCRFLCSYCYANLSEKAVAANLVRHRLSSPVLIGEVVTGSEGEEPGLFG